MMGYAVNYEEQQAIIENGIFKERLRDMAESPYKACITFQELCGHLSAEEVGSIVLQMLAKMELRGDVTRTPPVLFDLWVEQIKPAIDPATRKGAQ